MLGFDLSLTQKYHVPIYPKHSTSTKTSSTQAALGQEVSPKSTKSNPNSTKTFTHSKLQKSNLANVKQTSSKPSTSSQTKLKSYPTLTTKMSSSTTDAGSKARLSMKKKEIIAILRPIRKFNAIRKSSWSWKNNSPPVAFSSIMMMIRIIYYPS